MTTTWQSAPSPTATPIPADCRTVPLTAALAGFGREDGDDYYLDQFKIQYTSRSAEDDGGSSGIDEASESRVRIV